MPIRKLAARLEQDRSQLCWRARIYDLSAEQLDQCFQQLADTYRRVVLDEDAEQLEALLAQGPCCTL